MLFLALSIVVHVPCVLCNVYQQTIVLCVKVHYYVCMYVHVWRRDWGKVWSDLLDLPLAGCAEEAGKHTQCSGEWCLDTYVRMQLRVSGNHMVFTRNCCPEWL